MHRKNFNIFGFFTVFVLGIILGFLISPDDGKTNRNQVKNRAIKLVDELKDCLKNIFCLKNCYYNEDKQNNIEIINGVSNDDIEKSNQ